MQSLERRLGLFSVVTISISSMLGSGIFVLPGIGFEVTGPSLFIAFALSALMVLPAAMSKAELATAMPTSGGTYVYIAGTFGPFAGTVAGLGLFLSILLKASFALIGLGAYFIVLSSFPLIPTVLCFLAAIIILNIFGVGKVSSLLTLILGISVVSLCLLMGLASPWWNIENFQPLMLNGWNGLASATALVFVSFAGVTKVAAIAEEVRKPERNLPAGILISLLLVTLLYCAVSATLAGVFQYSEISGEIKPIFVLAEKVGGPVIGIFIALVAVLTMVNTSNAGILAGSRFPFAMSRDNLLPRFLGRLNKTYLTPVYSILFSGIVVTVVLLTMDVVKIAKLASAFMIMIYMVENVCVIVLRETRPQWYKPGYRAPLYPVLQAIGILSGLGLLISMGTLALFAILSIAIPGVIFYFAYAAKRTTRLGVLGIKGKRTDLIEESVNVPKRSYFFDTERNSQVVVCLFGKEKSADCLVEMGAALAEHGHIEVTSLMEIPEQTTLQDVKEEPAEMRSLRRRVRAMATGREEQISFDPIVTHDLARSIHEISQRVHCKWLVVEWRGRSRGALTIHNPIGWLKSHLHCHMAIFKDAGIRYIKSILVILNDDRNDQIVLETAEHLAEVNKAGITLVKWSNVAESKARKELKLESLKSTSSKMKAHSKVRLVEGKDAIATFVTETIEYELLILGSQDHSFMNSLFGAFDDRLIERAACSVLAVHAASGNQL